MCLTSVAKPLFFLFVQQVCKRMFGFIIEGYDTHACPFVQAWLHRLNFIPQKFIPFIHDPFFTFINLTSSIDNLCMIIDMTWIFIHSLDNFYAKNIVDNFFGWNKNINDISWMNFISSQNFMNFRGHSYIPLGWFVGPLEAHLGRPHGWSGLWQIWQSCLGYVNLAIGEWGLDNRAICTP
jgi:hypothetical protein